MSEEKLRRAAAAVRDAGALLVCAGAGMGVDSGLPDFRGDKGFWKAYPPYQRLGLGFINMANPAWFAQDPAMGWGFYGHRLQLYRDTVPHRGFEILRAWGEQMSGGCFVFTSNVDGQFQKAGFARDNIEECHGSIHHLQCARPCCDDIWSADGTTVEVEMETMCAAEPHPACPSCGALARPNILMFGDGGWLDERTGAQGRRQRQWLDDRAQDGLVIVECGAGTGVPTVRYESEFVVNRHDATLIRINVREPEVPAGQIGISMGAREALERIDALIE